MAQTYPPLVFMRNSTGEAFNVWKRNFIASSKFNAVDLTLDEYIEFVLSDEFLNPYTTNKLRYINEFCTANIGFLFNKNASYSIQEQINKQNIEYIKTEWRDYLIMEVILEEWAKAKQVFKPDNDFAKALLRTDKLEISRDMINHLPYNYFYLDLTECVDFKGISGVFVYTEVSKNNKGAKAALYILSEQRLIYSLYCGGKFNTNGIMTIDSTKLKTDDIGYDDIIINPERGEKFEDYTHNDDIINRADVYIFALQMIAYLSTEAPQLTESELTRKTYRPRSLNAPIKNKFSEIRIQDVGVRYGTEYRKIVHKIQASGNTENKERKGPVPHFRRAHWHTYWVGEGRTERRVKWIQPVFVNGSENSDVVIHKVKKEKHIC